MTGRSISLVLRVLAGPGAEGRLIGQAEVVATGEVVALHEPEELVRLVRRLSGDGRPGGSQPP